MNSFNTIDEIDNILKPLGFNRYTPPPFENNDGVAYCYQKCYRDDLGKKYFIDAKVFDFTWTDKVPMNYTVSYYCQLYKKGDHNAFNVEFMDWELNDVEDFIENMFGNTIEYYELYD